MTVHDDRFDERRVVETVCSTRTGRWRAAKASISPDCDSSQVL